MRIYYIDCGPVNFHGSNEAAMKAAFQMSRENDTTVQIELLNAPGTRRAMIDLASGIIGEGEVVATVGANYRRGRAHA